MPTIDYQGIKINIDTEGYLVNFDDWNDRVACALAEREGISKECPLTSEKLDILRFIRNHYKRYNSIPIVRSVCKNVHQPKECQLEQFPDPVTAAKIAGLPKLETGYTLM